MNFRTCALSAFVAVLCAASISSAASIEIQLVDVDIEFDAATALITDADAGSGVDPLSGIFFFVDGVQVDALVSPASDLAIDLEITGVDPISDAGDSVTAAGGTLDLLVDGAPILELTLNSVDVIYSPIPSSVAPIVEFVFAGSLGDIVGQSLPSGLLLGEPVTVTLSTQAADTLTSGGFVSSFAASGTGELTGPLVPEPTTLALAALATAPLLRRRRR